MELHVLMHYELQCYDKCASLTIIIMTFIYASMKVMKESYLRYKIKKETGHLYQDKQYRCVSRE